MHKKRTLNGLVMLNIKIKLNEETELASNSSN